MHIKERVSPVASSVRTGPQPRTSLPNLERGLAGDDIMIFGAKTDRSRPASEEPLLTTFRNTAIGSLIKAKSKRSWLRCMIVKMGALLLIHLGDSRRPFKSGPILEDPANGPYRRLSQSMFTRQVKSDLRHGLAITRRECPHGRF